MAWFRNYYSCERCGQEWTGDWSATCDDDCPHCGARHMSPYKSEDIAAPASKRNVRPTKLRQSINPTIIVSRPKAPRDYAKQADRPATLNKIGSALGSACGTPHYMAHRLQEATP